MNRAKVRRLASLSIALAGVLLFLALPVFAQPNLTVSPITWNIIGLDSNDVTVGPNTFPVGARVCNTGTSAATNVTSAFVWDSSDPYIDLRAGSLASYTGADAVASLAAGECHDFYYEVEVTRNAAAYDHTRRYHITAGADGPVSASSPQPRELYVEHLISQNRNSTNDVKLDGVSIAPGGTMVLYVGGTYDIQLLADTATNGYEQIETYINLINTIFKVNSVTTTYTADGGTDPDAATKLYADGCDWENDPNSLNYRSCLATGKYGGSVSVTYNVTIIGGGGTSQTLNTLIYDFSGSSYHYNSDYGVGARIAAVVDPSLVTIDKSFAPDPTNAGGVSTLTFTLTNPNDVPLSGASFSDTFPSTATGAPGDMVVSAPATYSTNNCGTPTFAPVAGAGSISFSDGTIPANGSCTVTVQVTAPAAGTYDNTSDNLFIDGNDTGDSASDSLTVDTSPPAPDPVCDLVMAQWTVPSTATDPPDSSGVPSTIASDVSTALASAGPGISANTGIATNEGQNDNYSWRSNGGFQPGTFDPANGDYFRFQVDTSAYEQVGLEFYSFRTSNGPQDLHIYFNTDGVAPGTFKTSFLGNAARTWTAFSIDFTGDTSPSGDTYFYVFGGNSSQVNPGADMHLDLITVTGCQDPEFPTISKSFSPDPIAVGGTSTLTFTLNNPNAFPLNGVAFDDDLPAGLQVASPANASTSGCGTPIWSPAAGDTSLSFSGGDIAGDGSCSVAVDVTATTSGPHTNVSGFISSTETGSNTGPDGSATDTLTALSPPSMVKLFSPNPILVNGISTLTFTITNPNPDDGLTGVAFDDDLPAGVVVASTPNASTTCGGSPTWSPGAGDTSLVFGTPSGASILAGGSCTVQVDVTSASQGVYDNTSGNVSADLVGDGNAASDSLTVNQAQPSISLLKQVSTASIGPWTAFVAVTAGDDVYYQFTVENTGDVVLSPVTVTDPDVSTSTCTWPASLPVAVAANDDHIATCVVGPITAISGLHSNTATATGTYSGADVSDTSTASYGTTGLTLDKTAAEGFFMAEGDVLNYSFQVTNSGAAPLAGPVTIDDDRATDESCPAVTTVGDFDDFLDSGESITCTGTYTVTAADVTAGSVTNNATATVDGVDSNEDSVTVPYAQPSIQVVKEVSIDGGSSWVDANSPPGPNLTSGTDPQFRFTVTNDGTETLTSIDLSDSDISSFFQSDLSTPCTIPGSLAASDSFVCYAELAWAGGQHSDTATASGDFGVSTLSDSDDAHYLGIFAPSISKDFSPNPIAGGDTSTLTFTLSNANATTDLTGVAFSDTFPTSPDNMVVAPTPNASTTCGGTVTAVAGAGSMSFSGGTIPANGSCTVSVDVTAPSDGSYDNTSETVTSSNGGDGNTASDTLTVTSLQAPTVAKAFSPATIAVGGTSTLTITITNPNAGTGLTGVAFSDTYPAGVENAAPLTTTNTCGGTLSATAGGGSLGLSGGTIAADDSCQVTVVVTSSTPGTVTNTTSAVSSNEAPNSTTASDDLTVTADAPTVTKAFSPSTIAAGGTSQLTITLGNTNTVAATLTSGFTDTLPASVVVANPPNVGGTCSGTVSATAGGSTITYTSGSTIPAGGCTITVDVTGSTPGTHSNGIAAGDLETDFGNNPSPASDDLTVLGPPSIAKNFSPDPIEAGAVSTLTFTLSNANATTDLTGVAFSDTFPTSPDNMVVATTPNASTTCGGTVTAVAGAGSMSFSGGTIPANGSCTVTVDVTAPSDGSYDNTSETVTSSNGGDGNTASDTLTVTVVSVIDPAVAKAVDPAVARVGDTVTFTLTITNEGNTLAEGVVVTDDIPLFLDIVDVNVAPSGPAVSRVGNSVEINIGDLGENDSYTVTIVTVVNSLGLPPGGTNEAELATTSDDADPDNNSDSVDLAIVRASALGAPETGFAPNRETLVPAQPESSAYRELDGLWLEIPSRGIETEIVGVPLQTEGWDVTWLWDKAGYLAGTAFPTWEGNSVITGHAVLADGLPGPFAGLAELRYGDRVVVHAWGAQYVYEVRDSALLRPHDASIFRHEELSWLTLVTCQGYDEKTETYLHRRVVRAVLMRIEAP